MQLFSIIKLCLTWTQDHLMYVGCLLLPRGGYTIRDPWKDPSIIPEGPSILVPPIPLPFYRFHLTRFTVKYTD